MHVKLSWCPSLNDILLLSKARKRDLVGKPLVMVKAEKRSEELSESTIREVDETGENWNLVRDHCGLMGDATRRNRFQALSR
jgi:hypothetical protein